MNKPNRQLAAYAGYGVDMLRIATSKFDNPHSLTKFFQLNGVRKRTNARTFIEAGTYLGVTARRCAGVFSQVHTIEIDAELALKARAVLTSNRNVTLWEGDAIQVLPSILEKPQVDRAIIFLDGHVAGGYDESGAMHAGEDVAVEPAIDGLELLARYKSKISGIVVDDFRLFGVEQGFPTKSELLQAAEKHFGEKEFSLRVHLDQLLIERRPTPLTD